MKAMSTRLFVSYTLRDNILNKEKLSVFKNALSKLHFLTTYIDILDNKNTASPQDEVINRLIDADVVWLIKSSAEFFKSEWVKREIEIANEYKKSIYEIGVDFVDSIIQAKSEDALLNIVNTYLDCVTSETISVFNQNNTAFSIA